MLNNMGLFGGAIYLNYIYSIVITSSYFHRNTALSFGGALYIDNMNLITFYNTTITFNDADIGGGMFYNSFYTQNFTGIIALNNSATIYA